MKAPFFYRAIAQDPEAVASHADYPVIELDLHARHTALISAKETLTEQLRAVPDFCDTKLAGWWVWGINAWIGGGWGSSIKKQIPNLGDSGRGVHKLSKRSGIYDWFAELSERLRTVRICTGDWSRVCGDSVTVKNGLTGVFLDPPYGSSTGRDMALYAHESGTVAQDVQNWCLERGVNPMYRIALCGYDTEHAVLEQYGWHVMQWNAGKGYAGVNDDNQNGKRERIWFSPHCLSEKNLFSMDMEV